MVKATIVQLAMAILWMPLWMLVMTPLSTRNSGSFQTALSTISTLLLKLLIGNNLNNQENMSM